MKLDNPYEITYDISVRFEEEDPMQSISISNARANLYNIVNSVEENHNPLLIIGKHNNAVLISEEDWNAIQETLYLLSIPGMKESLLKGKNTPPNECSKEIDWGD